MEGEGEVAGHPEYKAIVTLLYVEDESGQGKDGEGVE